MSRLILSAVAALLMTGGALADPIEGSWKTEAGPTATIAQCGGSFCVVMQTGKYVGKQIGKFKASGDGYTGTMTDPQNDKTYTGSAKLKGGSSLSMTGCAMKIFCQTQVWSRI